jgi:hypothetical protein
MRPDGDLEPTANPVLLQRHPFYPHAYVAVGAIHAGNTQAADRILDFLSSQTPRPRVAWGSPRTGDQLQRFDTISTAAVGLAFLERGELERARGAVAFLLRMLDIQPEPEAAFFSTIFEDGQLQTTFPDGDGGRDRCVRFASRFQVWWMLSFPLIFLARFAEATGEPEALRGALRYLSLLDRSPQAWNDMSAGKLALGCALLYRQAGDPGHRRRALKAIRAVVSRQLADGGWHACRGGEGGAADAPTALGFEVNLEFVLLMSLVGRALAERDGVAYAEPPTLQHGGRMLRWACLSERALLRAARGQAYRFHASRFARWLNQHSRDL